MNTALQAAQAEDTQDLLNHIAWTDVIRPQLEDARRAFTDQLVAATLKPQQPMSETREQIAGKLFGITFIINRLERILREGTNAREVLARENLFLQDFNSK